MIELLQHSTTSENLSVLKNLIELKNLGLLINSKDDKIILSITIKNRTFLSQGVTINEAVLQLLNVIIKN